MLVPSNVAPTTATSAMNTTSSAYSTNVWPSSARMRVMSASRYPYRLVNIQSHPLPAGHAGEADLRERGCDLAGTAVIAPELRLLVPACAGSYERSLDAATRKTASFT